MITIKLVPDRRKAKRNGSFPLVFRIISDGKTRDIPAGFSILEADWNEITGKLKKSLPYYSVIAPKLQEQELKYLGKIWEYEKKNNGYVNIQELKEYLISKRKAVITVKEFWLQEIEIMKKTKRHGGVRNYTGVLNTLDKVKSLDVPFERIDYNFLREVQTTLISRGVKTNTISNYLRNLRAVYNHAINAKEVDYSFYPFRAFKIKKEATLPHPISKEEMQKYFHLNLDPTSTFYDSWLLGKLIFLFAGINVADLFCLTAENLKSGRLIYFRSKTKKMYSIRILPHADEILKHFKMKGTKTLCGVLSDDAFENKPRLPYIIQEKSHTLNTHLKKISKLMECSENIRSYTFRYTIANLCKQFGYNVQLIAELLGHSYGLRVTGIYLEAYANADLDEMNEKVCNEVMK